MLNFSLRFRSLSICAGHNKICTPIRRQVWGYVLLDTRTANHNGLFSKTMLYLSQFNNITNIIEYVFFSFLGCRTMLSLF